MRGTCLMKRVSKFFAEQCESHAKVAFQGWKKLTYRGPEGEGSCEFNYSKDKQIEELGESLVAVAETIVEGSRLDWLLRYDRLGLDREMQSVEEAAGDGRMQEMAVACAAADPDGWRKLDPAARFERLGRVAEELRRARADLIGAALADGGKTLAESDPEVSEAVDFVEFYRANARWWQEQPGAPRPAQGRGGRRLAVELPHRHSLRRRRRGAGGGQHGDPQAGLRRRAGGLGTVPLLLAGGRLAEDAAIPPLLRRPGGPATGQPSGRRRRHPHRRHRNRPGHAPRQAVACT